MQRATLDVLACPSCRRGYRLDVEAESEHGVMRGTLTCEGCGTGVPILKGFPMFTEARLQAGGLDDLETRLFGTDEGYEAYRWQKDERDLWESYAAFHPFNESFRSLEPLMETLRAHLRPGDVVLDVWARTGWSGEWLAGQLPEHRVISLWEGDSSVLGYRGFGYWVGAGRSAPNLDIAFVAPNRPLPFKDGAFGAVYAYDTLHRYDLYPFAGECLRVARRDGMVLFAHLHLSNSEPDPFFERGCRKDHGRDYRAWLDRALAGGGRRGWVLSEADLFEGRPLADTPDTDHYNGAVLIAEAGKVRAPSPRPVPDEAFLLVNPLLRLDLARSTVAVEGALRDGDVGRHLDRHPIYRARLPKAPRPMNAADWLTLTLAAAGARAGEIRRRAGAGEALEGLVKDEILVSALVGERALAMQRFHANQSPPQSAGALLDRALGAAGPALVLADGSALSTEDMAHTVRALQTLLPEGPVTVGDTHEPLAFLNLLAALAGGRDVLLAADGVGLESLTEGLAEAFETGTPGAASCPSGEVTLPVGSISGAALIEAAAALRHMVRTDLSGVADFGGINTLLLCLIARLRGETITFGGLARPAP